MSLSSDPLSQKWNQCWGFTPVSFLKIFSYFNLLLSHQTKSISSASSPSYWSECGVTLQRSWTPWHLAVTVEVFLNPHSARSPEGNFAAGVKMIPHCMKKCCVVESEEKVPVDFKSL